jgi:hypothetical protein
MLSADMIDLILEGMKNANAIARIVRQCRATINMRTARQSG